MRSARLATPHMPPESRLVYSAKRCVYHSKNSLCGYVVNFGGSILCIHFTITAKVIYNNCSNLEIFGYKREREKKKIAKLRCRYYFIESWNLLTVFPYVAQLCGAGRESIDRLFPRNIYYLARLRFDLFLPCILFCRWLCREKYGWP